MSISNATIKSISKSILKENYLTSAVVTVIILSALFICSNVSSVISLAFGELVSVVLFLLLCYFVFAPLCMGALRYFWRLSCGVRDNPVCVFYYFSQKKAYFKTLRFILSLFFRITLRYLLYSIPVFAAQIISGTWLYSVLDISIPIWTVNLTEATYFLAWLAVIATLFSSIRLYLAPMLFLANENMDTSEILYLSTVIAKKSYLDYIFFAFSFAGWILLSLFVIPLILTIPYMVIAYLVYSSYAISEFNENILKNNQGDIPTFVAGV